MYIHIGEGKLINEKDLIGIFDLDTTTVSKKTREFLKISEKNKIIENISFEIPKSYIICEKNKNVNVYITQIASQTLYKRAERNEKFGREN